MKKFSTTLCFLWLFVAISAAQNPAPDSLHLNTLADKVYGLSLLWSELKYNFVHIDRLDFDIDSLYVETLEKVIDSKDDIEYYDELSRFMCAFKDGHTHLICGTPAYNIVSSDYPPCSTRLYSGKYYITGMFLPEMERYRELYGAEIVEVEGMSPAEYSKTHIEPFIPASTDMQREGMAAASLFIGPRNSKVSGKAVTRSGELVEFTLERDRVVKEESEFLAPPSVQRPRQATEISWADGTDIAVITLNTFAYEVICDHIDQVMAMVEENGAKGVVIDLRNNQGGITDVAWHLQKYLTPGDEMLSYGSQTRINSGYGRAQGNWREKYEDFYNYKAYETHQPDTIAIESSIKRLKVPTVILVGVNTFSACEDFLINIYEMPGRPLIIGRETSGSTGAPLVVYLPHGAVARLCTLRQMYPYSLTPFVGKGIVPDIEVPKTIEEYLADRDATMERAFEELRKMIKDNE